jgi:hypothetical protein
MLLASQGFATEKLRIKALSLSHFRIEYGIKVRYYEQSSSASERVRGFCNREMRCSNYEREKDHSTTAKVKVKRRQCING